MLLKQRNLTKPKVKKKNLSFMVYTEIFENTVVLVDIKSEKYKKIK